MIIKNLFNQKETQETIERINTLSIDTKSLWGKMDVSQMLAHCNVAYDIVYTDKYPKPNGFEKFMAKLFAKKTVIGAKPYKKNTPTAPIFRIKEQKNFADEKQLLINHLNKTQKLGSDHFNGLNNPAFGDLTNTQWNRLFSKHLDHHLKQFGV